MNQPACLFVVAAPSGSGKSSLVKALLQDDAQMSCSISHTTRSMRGQEQEGVEYHFVSDERFDQMLMEGDFVEWAHVHGRRYGTSRQAIERSMQQGQDVILEIDWQGALKIKSLFAEATLIFILPPSWQVLRQRLLARGEDSHETIELRLANAREELSHVKSFQYVIINDSFECALNDMKTVVRAQRLRYQAQKQAHKEVFEELSIS